MLQPNLRLKNLELGKIKPNKTQKKSSELLKKFIEKQMRKEIKKFKPNKKMMRVKNMTS